MMQGYQSGYLSWNASQIIGKRIEESNTRTDFEGQKSTECTQNLSCSKLLFPSCSKPNVPLIVPVQSKPVMLSWNEFQNRHKGRKWSKRRMSKEWQTYKRTGVLPVEVSSLTTKFQHSNKAEDSTVPTAGNSNPSSRPAEQ